MLLASFTVALEQTGEEWELPGATGGFVRALFYELLLSDSPILAEEIHSCQSDVPFTVSPLMRKSARDGESQSYRLRFTTLTEPVFDAVCRALYIKHKNGEPVRLSKGSFLVRSLDFKGRRSFCWLAEYEDLLKPPLVKSFSFRFMTPTAFKNGKMNVPLPIPRLMFQGYLRKWNRFAPDRLRMDESLISLVDEGVAISGHSISAHTLDMKAMKMVGFTGDCSLVVVSDMDERSLQELGALARFSLFSGTGAKTTIGMGQTVLVERL